MLLSKLALRKDSFFYFSVKIKNLEMDFLIGVLPVFLLYSWASISADEWRRFKWEWEGRRTIHSSFIYINGDNYVDNDNVKGIDLCLLIAYCGPIALL